MSKSQEMQPEYSAGEPPAAPTTPDELSRDIERKFMVAVMEADDAFQKAGAAGTKTWIREFLLSRLEAHGLGIGMKAHLRAAQPPCPECEKRRHANDRVNYETTEDGFRICRGYHHRSADCEWEYYVPRPSQPPGAAPELLALLRESRQHVASQADALLMLDGFGKHQRNNVDRLLAQINLAFEPPYAGKFGYDCKYCGNLRGDAHADECPRSALTKRPAREVPDERWIKHGDETSPGES